MLVAIRQFLSRPGVQSSEFKVLVAATVWLGVNDWQKYTSLLNSVVAATPAVVYAIARGLAKTEQRSQNPPPA